MSLIKGDCYNVSWIERIHPSVRISLYDKSSIYLPRNIEIEKDSDIRIFKTSRFSVGERSYFGPRFMCSCHCGVTIGKNCLFGPDVKIYDNNHIYSKEYGVSTVLSAESISIGNNCWIASNVVILKGAKIGNNCIIGANCVISGSISDGCIVHCDRNALTVHKIV